jgi:hypothetical protein
MRDKERETERQRDRERKMERECDREKRTMKGSRERKIKRGKGRGRARARARERERERERKRKMDRARERERQRDREKTYSQRQSRRWAVRSCGHSASHNPLLLLRHPLCSEQTQRRFNGIESVFGSAIGRSVWGSEMCVPDQHSDGSQTHTRIPRCNETIVSVSFFIYFYYFFVSLMVILKEYNFDWESVIY